MIGGIISELNGGSFSQGAIIGAASAAMSIGLNSLQSDELSAGRTNGIGADDIDRKGRNSLTVSKEVQEILEITEDTWNEAQSFKKNEGYIKIFEIFKDVAEKTQRFLDACTSGCERAFDLVTKSFKFANDTLHVRIYENAIKFHWDGYNMNVAPVRHVVIDSFWNAVRGGGW